MIAYLQAYKGQRQSQSAAEAIDRDGIAFFGQMSETTINCWNTATEYGPANIDVVEYNPKTLQFASGVKVTSIESIKVLRIIFAVFINCIFKII